MVYPKFEDIDICGGDDEINKAADVIFGLLKTAYIKLQNMWVWLDSVRAELAEGVATHHTKKFIKD